MKASDFLTPQCGFIEIRQHSLKVLNGEQGLEIPLERLENGRLTDASRERVRAALRDLLKKPRFWPRQQVLCAIGARGVSLRRVNLPAASREEFERVLLLQVESEFPLPPDDLAWGYLPANGRRGIGGPEGPTREFVVAARSLGVSEWRMLARHVLPNVLSPVIVAATLGVSNVIILETGLSYLGLGVQAPQASWGSIILDGSEQVDAAWWISFFPGLAIVMTVMAFNVVGDALRDALDPR